MSVYNRQEIQTPRQFPQDQAAFLAVSYSAQSFYETVTEEFVQPEEAFLWRFRCPRQQPLTFQGLNKRSIDPYRVLERTWGTQVTRLYAGFRLLRGLQHSSHHP